jgi:hypothetical protein
MNIHLQQFYQNTETFKTSSFTIICGCTQFLCHYLPIVLHCFLQKKFFNATLKKNILKGKTSYKGNVKTRLLVGFTTVFDPKQLCHNISIITISSVYQGNLDGQLYDC